MPLAVEPQAATGNPPRVFEHPGRAIAQADGIERQGGGAENVLPSTSAPLVSICVTAHNYARFLPACIDSILQQSYQPVECIVVDDGSTDGTDVVLDSYGDRIQVVRHEAARGQLAAIVSAFERARGQFVSFVDADDLLYRDSVAINIAAHVAPETYAAVSSSFQHIIDADGRVLATYPPLRMRSLLRLPKGSFSHSVISSSTTGPIPVTLYDPQANCAHEWLWGTMSSMMFRRDAAALVLEGGPSAFRICADAYLAQFCHALGGTLMIELPLGAYRRHGANNYATNAVIGAYSPLSSGRHEDNPRPLIAAHIRAHQREICRAVGARRFVALVEKFCPLPQALAILFDLGNEVKAPMYAWFLTLSVARHLRIVTYKVRRVFAALRLSEP